MASVLTRPPQWRMTVAFDGARGLDAIAADPTDLVLLDWIPPPLVVVSDRRSARAARGRTV
jgi:DNA-binding response OmpR family regulator